LVLSTRSPTKTAMASTYIYDVPFSSVETLERKISSHLRRWLGIPRSFSSLGLYSTSDKLQMPIKSITEEYNVTKARQVMMVRDSGDEKVRETGVAVDTGRKWRAADTVEEAESRLRHSDIVGTTTSGRL